MMALIAAGCILRDDRHFGYDWRNGFQNPIAADRLDRCAVGAALVVWQMTCGGGSDFWFNAGIVALIVGTVLRLFARFEYGGKQGTKSRQPPDR